MSAIHGVSVRRQAYNFASQRYGLWQQIKLSSTLGSELIQLSKLFQVMLNVCGNHNLLNEAEPSLYSVTSAVFFSCLYVFVEVVKIENSLNNPIYCDNVTPYANRPELSKCNCQNIHI